ncbi:MAG: hypothetical protein ACI4QB_05490, partial [Eubacteriales bacterium]
MASVTAGSCPEAVPAFVVDVPEHPASRPNSRTAANTKESFRLISVMQPLFSDKSCRPSSFSQDKSVFSIPQFFPGFNAILRFFRFL